MKQNNKMNRYFSTTQSVDSNRILYTPSDFAKNSLFYLQETGSLQAISPHISAREGLESFLCFIVLEGNGRLTYSGNTYRLSKGDCVFIDCNKSYSHSTGYGDDKLWTLRWCHFYSVSMTAIYEKYCARGGATCFLSIKLYDN